VGYLEEQNMAGLEAREIQAIENLTKEMQILNSNFLGLGKIIFILNENLVAFEKRIPKTVNVIEAHAKLMEAHGKLMS
jgi:hypothetical protein